MRKAMVIQDDLIRIGRQVHGLVTASLLQQGDLKRCGEENLKQLGSTVEALDKTLQLLESDSPLVADSEDYTTTLSRLKDECDAQFRAVTWKDVHRCWRRLYTDCILVWAVLELINVSADDISNDKRQAFTSLGETIHRLDLAIIVAATPGRGRRQVCLELIKVAQRMWDELDLHWAEAQEDGDDDRPRKKTRITQQCVDDDDDDDVHQRQQSSAAVSQPLHVRARRPVPELDVPPSLDKFAAHHYKQPFVLRGFATYWPAFDQYQEHARADNRTSTTTTKWSSGQYLSSIAGRGRVVPVEIGREYTDDEWTQQIMPWRDFLQMSGFLPTDDKTSSIKDGNNVYLAQHTLLEQFPDLKRDILMPDYVYGPPQGAKDEFPIYSPPIVTVERPLDEDEESDDRESLHQEQGVMTSLWIGPKDTLSPAHTDPYFNCFVQVVGSKAVWIAPPNSNDDGAMYCFGGPSPSSSPAPSSSSSSSSSSSPPHSSSSSSPAPQDLTQLMTNTSKVPVFQQGPTPPLYEDPYPAFTDTVEPLAMHTVLRAGDMLFLPPGWWHSIKSLEKSVSVSMWF